MSKAEIISTEAPVMGIYCKNAFEQLTEKEKQYTMRFANASWEGAKICYFQKNYESPAIFIILQLVFSADNQSLEQLKQKSLELISIEQYQAILAYCAGFFNNCSNYHTFGDNKFVPDVSQEVFFKFVQSSQNYIPNKKLIDNLWSEIKEYMFSVQGKFSKIGYPPNEGQSGYYSQNLSQKEIDEIDSFLQNQNISNLNTRIMKFTDIYYQVLVASVNIQSKVYEHNGKKIEVKTGDYSGFLKRVVKNLHEAKEYAVNKRQIDMLDKYIEHFQTGDIDAHKDSQRHWVKDISPIVETNIGFIESYLDPKSVRAEWEGFAALVDKEQSAITQKFVEKVPQLLQMMPWPKEFEKDLFLKPDFTCLSILAFGGAGTYLGINIPNYDDIRQNEGFKNVYLQNCLPKVKPGSLQFLSKEDQDIQIKWYNEMVFHKIIYHELLGHGCGKLLCQNADGTFNFDKDAIIDPISGENIQSYYKSNETWTGIFQALSQPYEECRADSVALYFSCFQESVQVLQPQHIESWKDLCIAQFLNFIYAGLNALQFYDPESKKFGQAHIHGRWVILQVLIESGNQFLTIEKSIDQVGKDTIVVKLDREQCFTTGKEAMKNFLLKLNIYKSSADYKKGSELFQKYSQVNDKFLEIRKIVIDNRKPRRLEIQGNLIQDFENRLQEYRIYEETHEGIVKSYIDRYPQFDKEMLDLFEKYQDITRPIK